MNDMNIFYCEDCECFLEFQEDPIDRRCPNCDGLLIRQSKCKNCGEWHHDWQSVWGFCIKCQIETDDKFKSMLGTFTKEQLEYLDNQFDGTALEAIV